MRDWRLWFCLAFLLFWGICVQMYSLELATLRSGLNYLYTSDTGNGFSIYREIATTGEYHFARGSLLHTSLMTTLVPAEIARAFNFDLILFYQYWHLAFFSLLPLGMFLIVKRRFGYIESCAAGVVLAGQFYFWNAYQLGRINMALLFFICGLLSILYVKNNRLKNVLVFLCALMVVITHYGTAFIVGGISLTAWGVGQLSDRKTVCNPTLAFYGVAVLVVSVIFYSLYAIGPLHYVKIVAVNSVTVTAADGTVEWMNGGTLYRLGGKLARREINSFDVLIRVNSLLVFWVTVWLIIAGLFFSRKCKGIMVYLGACSLLLLPLGLLSPGLARDYGIIRIYYTVLVMTIPAFIEGGYKLSRFMRLPGFYIPVILALANYSLFIGE